MKSDIFLKLRGFAILLIVWWHVYMRYTPDNIDNLNYYWLASSSSYLGVWIFIFLSGYLIGKGFFSGRYTVTSVGLLKFYGSRVLKLLPLYYLTLVYLQLAYGNDFAIPNEALLDYYTLSASEHIRISYLGYLWFVSVIFQLYLLSPLLYICIIKFQPFVKLRLVPVLLLFFFLLISPLTLFYRTGGWNIDTYHSEFYASVFVNFGYYFAGFTVASILDNLKKRHLDSMWLPLRLGLIGKRLVIGVLLVFLYIVATAATFNFTASFTENLFNQMISLPLTTVLVMSIIVIISELRNEYPQSQMQHSSWTPVNILGTIGSHAYTVYLMHYLVIF